MITKHICNICGKEFLNPKDCLDHEVHHKAVDLLGKWFCQQDIIKKEWNSRSTKVRTRFFMPIGYVDFEIPDNPNSVAMKCIVLETTCMGIRVEKTTVDLACFNEDDVQKSNEFCLKPISCGSEDVRDAVLGWVEDIMNNAIKEGLCLNYDQWKAIHDKKENTGGGDNNDT